MAGADYKCCDRCGRRVFYDANIEIDNGAQVMALCHVCGKTHELCIKKKKFKKGSNE